VRYGPKKKAWYVLHEYQARNGGRYVTGAFGCWGLIESTKIETDWDGRAGRRDRAAEAARRPSSRRASARSASCARATRRTARSSSGTRRARRASRRT
jgi:hypothetical protein